MSEQEESLEVGNHIKHRQVGQATDRDYQLVFDIEPAGQRIIEELAARYCKPSYVRGGHEAERESCYRAGAASVVNFILAKINQANDPSYRAEELNDE